MATITETVFLEAPFLQTPEDDAKVAAQIENSQTYLQDYLGKTDLQVYVESEYTPKEKLLVAYYTAYNITNTRATANVTGQNGQTPTINRLVKKTKADVVETEFESAGEENSFMLSMSDIAKTLKSKVCNVARSLGIALPECGCVVSKDSVEVGFLVVGC
jgi:hypothetical protein